jgi:hypothetical protein
VYCSQLVLLFWFCATVCLGAPVWKIQYFYDQNESSLEIRDFKCPSAEHCVAAGVLDFARHDSRNIAVLTFDGGAHWSQVDLKEQPQALMFVDPNTGWMATHEGVWGTVDGGRKWAKLAKLPGLEAIYFLDKNRGFAAGYPKSAYASSDGGKTWTMIAAAAEPSTETAETVYDFIAFSGDQHGFILGHSQKTRPGQAPAWLDPERAQRRPPPPATRILIETKDGGKTWKQFSKPGKSGLIAVTPGPPEASKRDTALGLFDFPAFTESATEVRQLDLVTNAQHDSYAAPDRLVTSMALFAEEGVIAGVEAKGQLKELPIPGKLVVLNSVNLETWEEMSVDYRAVARRAMLSGPDSRTLWVATDTGMILKRGK